MNNEKSNENHPEKEMPIRSAADPQGNTSYGSGALQVNTGSNNTAMGSQALELNTTGTENTAMGSQTLSSNTSGFHNTAMGHQALVVNTAGTDNTAIGFIAMKANTTGNFNNAIGTFALGENTFGENNNAFGSSSLNLNTTGNNNNAVGRFTLLFNQIGSNNNTLGAEALFSNITSNNTAVGHQAGLNITEGGDNTALGFQALDTPTTGIQNTAIGASADVQFGGLETNPSNCTALGFGAIGNQSNTVQIGNDAVTDVFFGDGTTPVLHAASITPSDERIKKDIRQDVPGIEFIKNLNPITYYRDIEQERKYNPHAGDSPVPKDTKRHTGFIAQEVEETAKLLNYDFDALHIPENKNTHLYKLSYSTFVVPLVKAVQEQQKQIEHQQGLIEALQLAVENLQATKH